MENIKMLSLLFIFLQVNLASAQENIEFKYFGEIVRFKKHPEKEFKFRVQQRSNSRMRAVRGQQVTRREFVPIGSISRQQNQAPASNEVAVPVLIANGEIEYVPNGKVIVQFKQQMSEKQLNTWMSNYGVEFEDIMTLQNGEHYIFTFEPGMQVLNLAHLMSQDIVVNQATPDMWKNIKVRSVPTESELNYRKSLLKLESGNQR